MLVMSHNGMASVKLKYYLFYFQLQKTEVLLHLYSTYHVMQYPLIDCILIATILCIYILYRGAR